MTTAVSLFAGVGGFDLALERSGIPVTSAVEIDKHCRGVLANHFPQAQLFTDVQEITGNDIGSCDILTAGWPCQGNSVAGRRGGMDDPRSGLWAEAARLLSDVRPQWFIGENVPGLLTVHGGADFYQVIKSLDELGYGYAWRVLDAQYFGVPQRRKRVFIVGCLGDGASPAEVLFEPESCGWDSAPGSEAGQGSPRAVVISTLQGGGRRGYRIDAEGAAGGHVIPVCVTGDITHALTTANNGKRSSEDGTGRGLPIITAPFPADGHNGLAGPPDGPMFTLSTQAVHNRSLVGANVGVRRLTPLECERLQGFPDGWTAGQSDSARYRQLGNAVAVPVAEWVVERIAALDSTSKRQAAA